MVARKAQIDFTPFQVGKCYLCGSPHVYALDLRTYGAMVCTPCGAEMLNQHRGGLSFFWYWDWLEAYGLRA